MKYLVRWTEEDFTGGVRLSKIIEADSAENALSKVKKHIEKVLNKYSTGSNASAGYIEVLTAPELIIIDPVHYDKKHMPYSDE